LINDSKKSKQKVKIGFTTKRHVRFNQTHYPRINVFKIRVTNLRKPVRCLFYLGKLANILSMIQVNQKCHFVKRTPFDTTEKS